MHALVMASGVFDLAIVFVIVLLCAITIVTPFTLAKTAASDLDPQKRLLATAVEVEKLKMAWRARHQRPGPEF